MLTKVETKCHNIYGNTKMNLFTAFCQTGEKEILSLSFLAYSSDIVGSSSGVCDQTSKFFVFHWEESMAGHMSVNEVY
jgi:hypothetical protein